MSIYNISPRISSTQSIQHLYTCILSPSISPPQMASTAANVQFHTKHGKIVQASKEAVSYMNLVSQYVAETYTAGEKITLKVKAQAFEKVVQYCELWARYKLEHVSVVNMSMYEVEFVKFHGAGLPMFFAVLRTADYMQVSPLVDLLTRELAQDLLKRHPDTLTHYLRVHPKYHQLV